jgi:predicted RNA methylase
MNGEAEACALVAAEVKSRFQLFKSKSRNIDPEAEIESSDLCIARVVAELDGIDLLDSRRDWVGDALEKFRTLEAKRLGGQFFTDQRVTELAMDLIGFDEKSDSLVDICAGTGGFLLAAARRLPTTLKKGPRLIGIEVDAELVQAGRRSLGHLTRSAFIERSDSLRQTKDWHPDAYPLVKENGQSLLASNPPFGTKIRIADKDILCHFDLAKTWSKKRDGDWAVSPTATPTSPDILFIERNVQLAKPGGKIVLVLPYQILSGPQLEFVREWILRHSYVRAVVDCPSETFQPWTGTKTSLVLLEKRKIPLATSRDSDDYEVFMAVGQRIGHDRRGKPVITSNGEIDTDFPAIGAAYRAFVGGERKLSEFHPDSFVVSLSDFLNQDQNRMNASAYTLASSEAKVVVQRIAQRQGWKLSTVGQEVEAVFFPNRFKRTYVEPDTSGSIPFLGGSQILAIEPSDGKFVHCDDPNVKSCLVREGWVLVTRSGSTGIISSVPRHWDGFAISEHVIRVVPKEGGLPGGYVEAFLASPLGQILISSGVFGSVIDEITPEHIADIPIPVPTSAKSKRSVASIHEVIEQVRNHRSDAAAALAKSRQDLLAVIS